MLRLAISSTVAVLVTTAASHAAISKATCSSLGSGLARTAVSILTLIDAARPNPFGTVVEEASGDAKKALTALVDAQKVFTAAGDAYIAALQDAAYQMQLCAR